LIQELFPVFSPNLLLSGNNVLNLGTDLGATTGLYYFPSPSLYSNAIVDGRLLINTTYYVRAYYTNRAGTSYGNVISFTTLNGPIEIPQVAVLGGDIEPVGDSVKLSGTITNNGGSNSFTSLGLLWGTQSGVTPSTIVNNGTLDPFYDISATLNGLVHGTTYYYVMYATNSAGTGYSSLQSFYYQ